ncbi:MAG: hypothetical protein ACFE9D_05580 [Promethearchaeota archaeon]
MRSRNIIGVILAIIAGIGLILAGYAVDSGFLFYLELIWTTFALPPELWPYVFIVSSILDFIALGGGFTVIVGAIVVILGWEGWGRWLIKLGTGLSILSMLFRIGKFVFTYVTANPGFVLMDLVINTLIFTASIFLANPVGWALILSLIAQQLIVKVPRSKARREKEEKGAKKELERKEE